jgi:2,3-bisphosphoglycerate-dependent phosphoglycerate mutase
VPRAFIPATEALKDTVERALPYWLEVIYPSLINHNEIIVVAHGNSLRGIIKYLKNISDEDIISLNLPTAVPYIFEFDNDLRLVADYFLGDAEEIKKLMEQVVNQAKKK